SILGGHDGDHTLAARLGQTALPAYSTATTAAGPSGASDVNLAAMASWDIRSRLPPNDYSDDNVTYWSLKLNIAPARFRMLAKYYSWFDPAVLRNLADRLRVKRSRMVDLSEDIGRIPSDLPKRAYLLGLEHPWQLFIVAGKLGV